MGQSINKLKNKESRNYFDNSSNEAEAHSNQKIMFRALSFYFIIFILVMVCLYLDNKRNYSISKGKVAVFVNSGIFNICLVDISLHFLIKKYLMSKVLIAMPWKLAIKYKLNLSLIKYISLLVLMGVLCPWKSHLKSDKIYPPRFVE